MSPVWVVILARKRSSTTWGWSTGIVFFYRYFGAATFSRTTDQWMTFGRGWLINRMLRISNATKGNLTDWNQTKRCLKIKNWWTFNPSFSKGIRLKVAGPKSFSHNTDTLTMVGPRVARERFSWDKLIKEKPRCFFSRYDLCYLLNFSEILIYVKSQTYSWVARQWHW